MRGKKITISKTGFTYKIPIEIIRNLFFLSRHLDLLYLYNTTATTTNHYVHAYTSYTRFTKLVLFSDLRILRILHSHAHTTRIHTHTQTHTPDDQPFTITVILLLLIFTTTVHTRTKLHTTDQRLPVLPEMYCSQTTLLFILFNIVIIYLYINIK